MVRLFSVALLALVAGAMAGCRDEPLRQYRAPRQPLDRTWLEFTKGAPEGWQRVSAAGRQFVEHAFAIGPAEHGLETTVSRLARQNIEGEAALAENINRWRRQLGLPPVPADEVHKHVAESFDQPQPAMVVDITGRAPRGFMPLRTVVAILPRDQHVWFVKMQGPAEAVAAHRRQLIDFARAMRVHHMPPPPRDDQAGAAPHAWQRMPRPPDRGDLPAGHPPLTDEASPVADQ